MQCHTYFLPLFFNFLVHSQHSFTTVSCSRCGLTKFCIGAGQCLLLGHSVCRHQLQFLLCTTALLMKFSMNLKHSFSAVIKLTLCMCSHLKQLLCCLKGFCNTLLSSSIHLVQAVCGCMLGGLCFQVQLFDGPCIFFFQTPNLCCSALRCRLW